MIRATTLRGRSVVDLDSAAKLGQLEELILDPEGRQVAGLIVGQGQVLFGERHDRVLPATTVNAIGPDALTVHGGSADFDADQLSTLPRLSAITGRKVVSHSGKMLGVISDVLILPEDGSIVGYALDAGNPTGRLDEIFGGGHGAGVGYIRAEADLRVGHDLVVVPDDALVPQPQDVPQPGESHQAGRNQSPVRWFSGRRSSEPRSVWTSGKDAGNAARAVPEPPIDVPVKRVSVHEIQTRPAPAPGQDEV